MDLCWPSDVSAFKVMSLSKFVPAFLPKSNRLLISWLQSWFAMIFGAHKDKICHCFNFFLFYLSWSNETRSRDLSFWNVEFQPSFFSLLFHPHQEPFSFSSLSAIRVVSSAYLKLLFLLATWFQLVIHLVWHFTWCTLHIS